MKPLLVAMFCLLLSFFVLITDSRFTVSLLENEEAISPTKQLVLHFFFLAPVPSVFNEQEQSHLTDVALLVRAALLVLILVSALLLYFKPNARTIYYGAGLLIAILLFAAVIPFEKLFTQFHYIFFPQGNWQFSADSTLIQYYPFTFFFKYATFIAAYSLLISFVLCSFAFFSTRNKQ